MYLYLYTLDSHDCFGRFISAEEAHRWAARNPNISTYELMTKPPFADTIVLNPHDLEMIDAFQGMNK
jgi:hypothetical protein